jgi:hypothetical protein
MHRRPNSHNSRRPFRRDSLEIYDGESSDESDYAEYEHRRYVQEVLLHRMQNEQRERYDNRCGVVGSTTRGNDSTNDNLSEDSSDHADKQRQEQRFEDKDCDSCRGRNEHYSDGPFETTPKDDPLNQKGGGRELGHKQITAHMRTQDVALAEPA